MRLTPLAGALGRAGGFGRDRLSKLGVPVLAVEPAFGLGVVFSLGCCGGGLVSPGRGWNESVPGWDGAVLLVPFVTAPVFMLLVPVALVPVVLEVPAVLAPVVLAPVVLAPVVLAPVVLAPVVLAVPVWLDVPVALAASVPRVFDSREVVAEVGVRPGAVSRLLALAPAAFVAPNPAVADPGGLSIEVIVPAGVPLTSGAARPSETRSPALRPARSDTAAPRTSRTRLAPVESITVRRRPAASTLTTSAVPMFWAPLEVADALTEGRFVRAAKPDCGRMSLTVRRSDVPLPVTW